MNFDLVRDRHCVSMYTLLISYDLERVDRLAYLAFDLKSPNRGIIALTSIQL
jgi:hypothetical protein